jgi:hypothetical protein
LFPHFGYFSCDLYAEICLKNKLLMLIQLKNRISDWTVIILGLTGLFLGLSGLFAPVAQLHMLGLEDTSTAVGLAIKGLMRSGSVSAVYIGLLYLLGTWKQWEGFKLYLIFARFLMTIGFVALFLSGPSLGVFKSAAAWEGGGAVLILIALFADRLFAERITGRNN